MKNKKFKALVHLIIDQCSDDPAKLGATRLNKAIWFSDVLSYQLHGKTISGQTFVKRQNGPVPDRILPTLRELEEQDRIAIKEPQFEYDTRRFLSTQKVDVTSLTEHEIGLVSYAVKYVCDQTATAVSDETHDVIWKAARMGEEIPIFAIFAANFGEITEEVKVWAEETISQGI
jgi:hypothetical protein